MEENHQLLFTSIQKHVSISDTELDDLLSIAKVRKVKKGQYLVHEGANVRKTFFIKTGIAIAYYIDLNGSEHVIQFAIEGWWISDIQSYVYGKNSVLNVQAMEDSEVYEFLYDDMVGIHEKIPSVQRYFLNITQNAFASFQERVLNNLYLPAEGRYTALIKKYPFIEQRLSQKLIASYLGISPEFLSKIKKRLL